MCLSTWRIYGRTRVVVDARQCGSCRFSRRLALHSAKGTSLVAPAGWIMLGVVTPLQDPDSAALAGLLYYVFHAFWLQGWLMENAHALCCTG